MNASPAMKQYFAKLEKECLRLYAVASEARKKGYDPDLVVEVNLAKNMAERVVGLISVVAPQIKGSGAAERIVALEQQYGLLDWRVALTIAEEVARQKFCTFPSEKEAIEVGIRTGFAYITVGVVSSPLEGFTSIDIKSRLDGTGQYFCLNFSGPIRNAGGTAASVCVLIADYVRKKFGYAAYDPTLTEIKRCHAELEDYHEYVTNLQYFPSTAESEFLMQNIPVEIGGDPSEDREVSNYKDIPRIQTNKLRSGYCLIHSSCIPLKAPKLWAPLKQWGKDFAMDHWAFLEKFLVVQKREKSQKKKESSEKITPDYTYIKDLVAGRPVLGHPLRAGAFRLRYGRCRTSGFSSQALHPATLRILNEFIAIGTQLKTERPGKATAITSCDTIEGPIVKLHDGSVVFVETEEQAKQVRQQVKEILFAGDLLVSYGDFFDRAHVLVPPGYCQEQWILELEKAIVHRYGDLDCAAVHEQTGITEENLINLFKNPLRTKLSARAAIALAKATDTSLHPRYTYHWKTITYDQLFALFSWLGEAIIEENKIIIPYQKQEGKRTLELLGIPHLFINFEYVVIEKEDAQALLAQLPSFSQDPRQAAIELQAKAQAHVQDNNPLDFIKVISSVKLHDKSGIFVGTRMARPEKAKMRKLTGSPHTLFPIGEEGGKLRSFQSALLRGKITANFPLCFCQHCNKETVLSVCETCDTITERKTIATQKGMVKYKEQALEVQPLFAALLKKLKMNVYPDLIKGIRGTSNKEHTPEHPAKGILRAKHGVFVNKDGTVRYDVSEIALTHFKPAEIGISVEEASALGYMYDKDGKPLTNPEQVVEIKPQDIVLPCCPDSPEESADEVLFRTANFVDDLLVRLYGLKPYFSLRAKHDLLGQLIVGLAPHTSAGILGRIIGFSKTQGYFAHPLFHAAMRRDLDGDESCILLLADVFLNFSRQYLPESRGSTMDAPLVLTFVLDPAEVDDMIFKMDIAWQYPLEFYEAAQLYKMPWEVKVRQLKHVLSTEQQYDGWGFTHDTTDLNAGVLCSQYKLLVTMEDKLKGQMDLAKKLRAVDEADVAQRVIEKHFIRDIRGNLRKFSSQEFRCVDCNEKYRRPPLIGKCKKCGGKLLFTISQGSIVKYLDPTISLARAYNLSTYLQQSIELLKRRVESYFGKETEMQSGLGAWFG
ncbi:MAG: DNA polymerase II large subunit [archaeon]